MSQQSTARTLCALLTLITCWSCGGGSDGSGPIDTLVGGATGAGGAVASGGQVGQGGSLASGGANTTGGMVTTGGSVATGGALSTGGTVATGGGVNATGGAAPTGGSTVAATGGAQSTGGARNTGGGNAGGVNAGGAATGGAATGGKAAGGIATGGVATGGAATGGKAAGGAATGGNTGVGGATPGAANSIAYIGCSMANNIGNGYKRVGGKVMWNSDSYQTGAMVVQNWTSSTSSSWQLFDQKMASIGGKSVVKGIMIQICIFSSRATDAEIKSMITSARAHVNPGTHIYMVGQPQYEAGHECSLAGTGGAQWTDQKAQQMAADTSINQDMTYLGKFVLDSTKGEVMSDTCHATTTGEDVLGREAMAFFGG